jgi:hypothetical protein
MDDSEFYQEMAEKYKRQALAALQLAKEWEEIANERQQLLDQMITLISAKQMLAVALPTRGDA